MFSDTANDSANSDNGEDAPRMRTFSHISEADDADESSSKQGDTETDIDEKDKHKSLDRLQEIYIDVEASKNFSLTSELSKGSLKSIEVASLWPVGI